MKFSSGKALADGLVDVIKEHVAAELRRHVEETERRSATRIQELERRVAELERARGSKQVRLWAA